MAARKIPGHRVGAVHGSKAQKRRAGHPLENFAVKATYWSGRSEAFLIAAGVIVVWALLGPVFDYSDTWQLVINTGTTIVTFLMVFLIQRAQNKEALALHLKLNELVAAMEGASNRLIDAEELSEEELKILHDHYERLTAIASRDGELSESHSVEEAEERHQRKTRTRTGKTHA